CRTARNHQSQARAVVLHSAIRANADCEVECFDGREIVCEVKRRLVTKSVNTCCEQRSGSILQDMHISGGVPRVDALEPTAGCEPITGWGGPPNDAEFARTKLITTRMQ